MPSTCWKHVLAEYERLLGNELADTRSARDALSRWRSAGGGRGETPLQTGPVRFVQTGSARREGWRCHRRACLLVPVADAAMVTTDAAELRRVAGGPVLAFGGRACRVRTCDPTHTGGVRCARGGRLGLDGRAEEPDSNDERCNGAADDAAAGQASARRRIVTARQVSPARVRSRTGSQRGAS